MCAPHCQVGDLKRRNVNEKFLAYFFFHIAKPIFVILCYNCLSLKTVASHFKNYYQNFKYLSVEGFFLKILVCQKLLKIIIHLHYMQTYIIFPTNTSCCTYSCKLAVFTEKHFINILLYIECVYVEAVPIIDRIIRWSHKLSSKSQGCIIPGI